MSFAEHLPPTPALSSSLTIIITTSPVRSNPSLALLHETFATFQFGNSSQTTTNFTSCKKIIVCDGFRQKHTDSTSRKHSGTKAAMRSGFVDDEQRENYIKFKANLADRVKSASTAPEDDFYNTTILELQSRHGYGFALKEAVKTVETQFVCVIQHDRTFMRRTPILEVVKAMENDGAVKYVGILMRSNLVYLDQTMKYGKAIFGQMERAIKRPKELLLNSREYNNKSVCEELYGRFPRCGEKYRALREQYRANLTYRKLVETSLVPSGEGEEDGEGEKEKVQSSLIPTLFWSDNIHVAVTAHYRGGLSEWLPPPHTY